MILLRSPQNVEKRLEIIVDHPRKTCMTSNPPLNTPCSTSQRLDRGTRLRGLGGMQTLQAVQGVIRTFCGELFFLS